jgi:glycosyltransferase involved in cell wall biosynthesis
MRGARVVPRPLYRAYQVGHWLRRREWRVAATLLRGGPPPRAAGAAPQARVSVALTVYNRTTLALEAVCQVAADPRIAEIVVCDDASDPPAYERLRALLTALGPKVRLYRNDRNRGPLWNKHRAVSLCTQEFAILFDSDNVLDPAYVDRLFAAAPWRRDCFYCPEYARPHFDLRIFGGVTLDLALIRRLLLGAPGDRRLKLLLNDGNYLVPVREYSDAIGPFRDLTVHAADALAATYLWLRQGGRLHVLRGLAYDHPVHEGSYSMATAAESKPVTAEIRAAILAERPWPAGATAGPRDPAAGRGGP